MRVRSEIGSILESVREVYSIYPAHCRKKNESILCILVHYENVGLIAKDAIDVEITDSDLSNFEIVSVEGEFHLLHKIFKGNPSNMVEVIDGGDQPRLQFEIDVKEYNAKMEDI